MTVTRWFHNKTHGGMDTVSNQVQQVWAARVSMQLLKELLIPALPVKNPQIYILCVNSEISHGHFSHSKDCK